MCSDMRTRQSPVDVNARVVEHVDTDVSSTPRNSAKRLDLSRHWTVGREELVVDCQTILIGRQRRQIDVFIVCNVRRSSVHCLPYVKAFCVG